MFYELAAIILPVLIVPAIGFIWARMGKGLDPRSITPLVTNIGTPALAADILSRVELQSGALVEMALLSAGCFLGFLALGLLVLKFMRLPAHSYLSACVFPNSGNMGLPLCLFAFGEKGLALAVIFFTISATLHFTLGISITSGEVSLKRLVRLPIVYAVLLSIIVLSTGWQLPKFASNTLHILGGLTIPLMLLMLGMSLATLRVTRLPRNLLLSLVRIVGGGAIGFLVGRLFGSDAGLASGVLLIQSAMPTAVFSYLFAQYYEREPADVAAMVVISTLLSFVSLPLLIYFVL